MYNQLRTEMDTAFEAQARLEDNQQEVRCGCGMTVTVSVLLPGFVSCLVIACFLRVLIGTLF